MKFYKEILTNTGPKPLFKNSFYYKKILGQNYKFINKKILKIKIKYFM